MAKVSSTSGKELCKVEITSPSGNTIIADEPADKGGKDTGLSPKELLAASLAACTSVTVRMYAEKKAWDLNEVKVEIELGRDVHTNRTTIKRKLQLIGNLDEAQRGRLLTVANGCPIHKMLSNPIDIFTQLIGVQ